MTIAQKQYLKKWIITIGFFLYCIALLIFLFIGSETNNWMMWVGCGMLIAPAVPIAFAAFYIPIATIVWHWRLMGECTTDWETETLQRWWFFIRRSDTWKEYISEDIHENFSEEETEQYNKLVDFMYRLKSIKKPRWL